MAEPLTDIPESPVCSMARPALMQYQYPLRCTILCGQTSYLLKKQHVFVVCVRVCGRVASLCLDGTVADEEVRQIAATLQAFLDLTEPVQQIQLVKKVSGNR